MSMPVELTDEQIEQLGHEIDAIREEVMNDLGQEDADYIRRIVRVQRSCEAGGRALLMAGILPPAWLAGTSLLSLSKILENMEIGHNVMHGQWDWMRDPKLHSANYEWDTASPAEEWKHSHNFVHHTFTNIVGRDRDVGYGILRMAPDQPWKPVYLAQPLYNWALAGLFQWGVALHDLEFERIGKSKSLREAGSQSLRILRKARKQVAKDYVVFPLLGGPMAPLILAGNINANFVRNLWAYMIIFCGHFTEDAEMFTEDVLENESRGHWYLRQILGSSNLEGGKLMHIMSGNLSHQIEHHLFPDMPSNRYAEVKPRIQEICQRYGIHYNTGRLSRQFGTVMKRVARLALPGGKKGSTGMEAAEPASAESDQRGAELPAAA